MDRKLRNRILLYLLLAGVLAYGLIELSGRKPAPKISAVTPMRENLVSSINSNGKVEPIAPYVIPARLDTFVERVLATEGQQVKKGQLLLELDVKDAAAQLAEARVRLLRAQVDSLEEKVRNGHITAPVSGTLYSLPVKTGDFVKLGATLAEMADLHKVRVRAFIDEPELGALEENEPVKITWDALPNKTWSGRTEIIPKQVVPRGTRSVGELLCSVNNDKLELLPNINVNVRINSRERLGVLSVPRGAVEAEGGRRYVYVVKENQLGVGKSTLEKREIHVGIADATNYEVVSGLQEEELVALPGDVDLRDA